MRKFTIIRQPPSSSQANKKMNISTKNSIISNRQQLGGKLFSGVMIAALVFLAGCGGESGPTETEPLSATEAAPAAATPTLPPLRVAGRYWIELSPVIVAANHFYPQQLPVANNGITQITAGEIDIATNAETQLLRESVVNPDLRIIATVTESFYRLVARKSAGISTLKDIAGKRVMLPTNTSAHYYLVAMLETVGLTEADVTIVPMTTPDPDNVNMDSMSDLLAAGEVDVISIWEPEPEDSIEKLGDDAIVFQDRSVYREVFNLHARAPDLANPDKRRAIVAFVRAVADASDALRADPAPYRPLVSSITGFPDELISASWSEMEFPVRIVPDMLDVLEREDIWVAKELNRPPRSREELAQFIDYSIVDEALSGR
jgi:sulfonate transport system substrate-binding protein